MTQTKRKLDLVGAGTVAREFGVTRTTVFRWIEEGKLSPIGQLESGTGRTSAVIFDRRDVDAFRRSRELVAASA